MFSCLSWFHPSTVLRLSLLLDLAVAILSRLEGISLCSCPTSLLAKKLMDLFSNIVHESVPAPTLALPLLPTDTHTSTGSRFKDFKMKEMNKFCLKIYKSDSFEAIRIFCLLKKKVFQQKSNF